MDTVISSISIAQLLQHSNSKWVTRERPKIDRIACPWLIRRFMHQQGMVIYDAFYAWIRSARAEFHNADLFTKQA
jgi:hypothetical protein